MTTFFNSPQVVANEVDLTTSVVAPATGTVAIAGAFTWGPVKQILNFGSEGEVVEVLGKPNNDTAVTFFTLTNALSYVGNARVVRVGASGMINATSGATGVLVENETDYTQNHSAGISGTTWVAKYPGVLGNSIGVSICDQEKFPTWQFKGFFASAPSTSSYAARTNANANDELHVVVYDATGAITGSANTILEKYEFVSKASDAKTENGENNYYKDVINRKSRWVWWGNHHAGATGPGVAWGSTSPGATGFATFGATGPIYQTLAGGVDGNVLQSAHEIAGYDLFKPENVTYDVLMAGGSLPTTVEYLIDNIAEYRKNIVVTVSPEKDDVVDNFESEVTDVTAFRNTLNSSTYVFVDSGWKYQYDKYNDVFRWIPLNGDTAGLIARVDPWVPPAGLNRGFVKNVFKLAWEPSKADRDLIYPVGINPVFTMEGQGAVLFGDRTMTSKPSAFDRINVRRLFILLRTAISRTAQFTIFELNNEFTRARFVASVEPFLRDLKGRGAIVDGIVRCDDKNNTPQVINSNSFVADIFIKPPRSINYIRLNFVAIPEGITLTEIAGSSQLF